MKMPQATSGFQRDPSARPWDGPAQCRCQIGTRVGLAVNGVGIPLHGLQLHSKANPTIELEHVCLAPC